MKEVHLGCQISDLFNYKLEKIVQHSESLSEDSCCKFKYNFQLQLKERTYKIMTDQILEMKKYKTHPLTYNLLT